MTEILNIFDDDAFSMMSMSLPLEKTQYIPTMATTVGTFTRLSVPTENVAQEEMDHATQVIQTSLRGEPRTILGREKRDLRDFKSVRIGQTDSIRAAEVAKVRQFATNQLESVQNLVARSVRKMNRNMLATKEMHRLGLLQGIWLDADGSVIYDYFSEFGVAQPAEIDWSGTAENTLTTNVRNLTRSMVASLGGIAAPGMEIVGLAGDAFYDHVTTHVDYKDQYKATNEAPSKLLDGSVYGETIVGRGASGGIRLINYQGNTGLNANLAITSDECKFFLRGVEGLFQEIYTTGESMSDVNNLGLPVYAKTIPDRDRDEYVDVDMDSYPVFICSRPETLRRASLTP
ncbi:MAG: major capsid protein [Pseudomonadota bacterium]